MTCQKFALMMDRLNFLTNKISFFLVFGWIWQNLAVEKPRQQNVYLQNILKRFETEGIEKYAF